MLNTSAIDLASLIEQTSPVRLGKPAGTGEKRTRKGNCPFCKMGTDRFAVFIDGNPQHYYCGIHGNGCGAHGDAITFLQEYKGLSFYEACQELSLDVSLYSRADKEKHVSRTQAPCKEWQERAESLTSRAIKMLWTTRGGKALEYLHSRGLKDSTIQEFQLGYIPFDPSQAGTKWIVDEYSNWGLPDNGDISTFKIAEGILIPWYVDGKIWKVNIRLFESYVWFKDKPKKLKYLPIPGSSDALFGLDVKEAHATMWNDTESVVIVEGEFDAMIGMQCSGVPFIATGSTTHGRNKYWVDKIASTTSKALVAYDNDESGHSASKYWLEHLPRALRHIPSSHDINQMLLDGKNIKIWVNVGIKLLSPIVEITIPVVCSECGKDVEYYTDAGQAFCFEHGPLAQVPQKSIIEAVDLPCIEDIDKEPSLFVDGPMPTLEQYMRQTRPAYAPVSLSELPRKQCPCFVGVDDSLKKRFQCKNKPTENGWCEDHKWNYALLVIGAVLGYPDVEDDVLPGGGIVRGVVHWEYYAELRPSNKIRKDIALIRKSYGV